LRFVVGVRDDSNVVVTVQFKDFKIEYKSPKEASIKKDTGGKPQAAIVFEGEHDNIARFDWKNFKKPAEEEPPLVYVYSSTNSDLDRPERSKR
jgi:hypothetical protein